MQSTPNSPLNLNLIIFFRTKFDFVERFLRRQAKYHHENICMLVLMLVLLFVPMKSSRFFCFYLPTCIITLRQGGAQTHAHAPISLLLQFSRGKKEENKNSRMQFRFRQFRLWVRDSLKKTGKALHTKTTSTTTTTVKLHHKEPEKLKRWHCCCFTTTSLHPEMHQTSFSCRDFVFFRRFFTPNTKKGA